MASECNVWQSLTCSFSWNERGKFPPKLLERALLCWINKCGCPLCEAVPKAAGKVSCWLLADRFLWRSSFSAGQPSLLLLLQAPPADPGGVCDLTGKLGWFPGCKSITWGKFGVLAWLDPSHSQVWTGEDNVPKRLSGNFDSLRAFESRSQFQ